ncbi:hypothetical protein [Maribacter aestuarii]|uniref:hypothetical protein n=1 Tax=Maribacter aestuarii TaxID=1130723 RepID=UPI00248B71B3|nr:hypothetical protein [Maribacter aestuarii]
MEKLAYGLSLLMVVYIAFLYLTVKLLGQDILKGKHNSFSIVKKEKRPPAEKPIKK